MKLRMLSLTVIIILLSIGLLIIFKKFFLSLVVFLLFGFLLIIWYKMMLEYLIVYFIKSHGSKIKYQDIIKQFGNKAKPAIEKLINKNRIFREDDELYFK